MAAPRWASLDRSCDQYGMKLRADHGGSTPGGVLVGARGAPPALEQAKHLRRGPPEHFEHTRDDVMAVNLIGTCYKGLTATDPAAPTYTHIPYVTTQERLSRLPNAAAQPRGQPPHRRHG